MSKIGFSIYGEGADKAASDIASVTYELTELSKELAKAKKEGDRAGYEKLSKQAAFLREQKKDLNKVVRESKKEIENENKSLDDLANKFRIGGVSVGEFKTVLGNAGKALNLSKKAIVANSSALNVFKLALASTGVGLIVIALGSLVAYLTQTQKGIDLVNRGFANFKSIIGTVVDAFARFKDEGFAAFNGIGQNIVDNIKATDSLTKTTQALREERRALAVETEKVRTREKELSKIAEDTSATAAERSAAAAEGIRIEEELLAKREDFARRNLAAIQEEVRLKGELAKSEDLDKIAEAEIELANIREESVERQTTLNSKLNVSNAALAKQVSDIAKGPMESLKAKIKDIEELVNSGSLDQAGLTAKIREMLNLKGEVDAMEEKIRSITAQVSREGDDTSVVGQLGTPDLIPSAIDPLGDPRLAREKEFNTAINELQKNQSEFEIEQDKKKKKELLEQAETFENQRLAVLESASDKIGEVVGELFSGQIETFKDFENALLGTLLDGVEKAINVLLAQAFAKQFADKPAPLAVAAFGVIQGLVKGFFSGVKASVKKNERGGLTDGAVLQGPSHSQGGIPIGHDEFEGGEAIINKKSTSMFKPLLSQINSYNNYGRKFARGGLALSNNIPNFVSSSVGSSSFAAGSASNAFISEESTAAMAGAVSQAVREGIGLGLMDANRQNERSNIYRRTSRI